MARKYTVEELGRLVKMAKESDVEDLEYLSIHQEDETKALLFNYVYEDGLMPLHFMLLKGWISWIRFVFHFASENGSFSTVSQLRSPSLLSIGHYIVLYSKENILELLDLFHNYGGDLNLLDNKNRSPLHYAVINENVEVARYLCEQNVTLVRDNQGMSALELALLSGNIGIVSLMRSYIEATEDPVRLIQCSLVSGNHEIIDFVVSILNIELHTLRGPLSGQNPLHWVVQTKLSSEFLKSQPPLVALVNERDKLKRTPLHFASKYSSSEVLSVLIQNGGDLMARDNHNATTYHYAASGNKDNLYHLLQHAKAPFSLDTCEGSEFPQMSCFHICCYRGNLNGVNTIISELGDFNNPCTYDKNRHSPLFYAAISNNPTIFEKVTSLMKQKKIQFNIKNEIGMVHKMIFFGWGIEIFCLLESICDNEEFILCLTSVLNRCTIENEIVKLLQIEYNI